MSLTDEKFTLAELAELDHSSKTLSGAELSSSAHLSQIAQLTKFSTLVIETQFIVTFEEIEHCFKSYDRLNVINEWRLLDRIKRTNVLISGFILCYYNNNYEIIK